MTREWETPALYKRVLRVGGVWNLFVSIPTVFLVAYLPDMFDLAPPVHPIFIYFNRMTVMLFGFIQFYVAVHPAEMRGMMIILMWSKMLTASVFAAGILFLSMSGKLIKFLTPSMCIDFIFGCILLAIPVLQSAGCGSLNVPSSTSAITRPIVA